VSQSAENYERACADPDALTLVGLGSVCRQQGTVMVAGLVQTLAPTGLRIHGFGGKPKGLERVAPFLASADSLAVGRFSAEDAQFDELLASRAIAVKQAAGQRPGVVDRA
jgi:hypothetical protein